MSFLISVVLGAIVVIFGIGMLLGLAKREVNRRTDAAVAPWQSKPSSPMDDKGA